MVNTTRNQHFISQSELRLNAFNPNASPRNKKFYSFSVQNRENFQICMDSPKGKRIEKTFCLDDLFSFEILDKSKRRYNFEALFQQYENNIESNTLSLIKKLQHIESNIKLEIVEIFASKLINFVRNPYSIKKILNTFSIILDYHPENTEHYDRAVRVISGRKPHINYLCQELGITDDEYLKWLLVIFMLNNDFDDQNPNFLKQTINSLFEDPELYIMVIIYSYDNESCLLCDRGFISPIPENEHFAFDFNLTSHAFIRYCFGNINKLAPANLSREFIELFKSKSKNINVFHKKNDLEALSKYNRSAVYQCFRTVYNSQAECYGL